MNQPLNPNTLLPMSLEVDRINQIQFQAPGEQQANLIQQMKEKKQLKQRRVNSKEETESAKIRDDGTTDKNTKNAENKAGKKNSKGSLIDFKI